MGELKEPTDPFAGAINAQERAEIEAKFEGLVGNKAESLSVSPLGLVEVKLSNGTVLVFENKNAMIVNADTFRKMAQEDKTEAG